MGDRHVFLFISHDLGTQYVIGEWIDETFRPERHGMMNWSGGRFFAPETLLDDRGRRILWGWVPEAQAHHCGEAAGWSGVMSLPRVLSLAADRSLRITPIEALQHLRTGLRSREQVQIPAGGEVALPEMAGNQQELQVVFAPAPAQVCGLKVCRSPDGRKRLS